MKAWTITIPDHELPITEILEADFREQPRRVKALRAYTKLQDTDISEWSPLIVLGFYIHCYEQRHHRRWTLDPCEGYRDVALLCEREGVDWTVWGIKAIFSERMRWVTTDQLTFLCRKDLFAKHVVPVIDFSKRQPMRGEQSEWSNQEGAKNRYRVVKL
jgi:hypothetical protein